MSELPPNEPQEHAGDLVSRSSRTGFIVFLNNAPIHWFSKKQTIIETLSFSSEFLAMKQCCEYIQDLKYKLRMMDISIDEPSLFGDNQSLLDNTSLPHSTLKKKSSSIVLYFIRGCISKNEWLTTYRNTNLNPSNMLTQSLPGGQKTINIYLIFTPVHR